MDITEIKQNYTENSLSELEILLSDMETMRIDALHALFEEFNNREENELADRVQVFLIGSGQETKSDQEKFDEIKNYISEQLEDGAPLNEIKLDLAEQGINIFDIIGHEAEAKEEVETVGMDEHEKGKYESRKRKRMLGLVISILGMLIALIILAQGGRNLRLALPILISGLSIMLFNQGPKKK
ncbi:MAG: hypothetical protein QNK23_04695 [Crocinitomicaceae bacterium]|nr:hypothetical protein [Crocinitomicaceae bacterium]